MLSILPAQFLTGSRGPHQVIDLNIGHNQGWLGGPGKSYTVAFFAPEPELLPADEMLKEPLMCQYH